MEGTSNSGGGGGGGGVHLKIDNNPIISLNFESVLNPLLHGGGVNLTTDLLFNLFLLN